MDPSLYKDFSTSRGLNYHYYFSPSKESKPTLLFLHGFPSTSYDWHHQVDFFQKEGYGLIVPDQLGYGGTSKPTEVEAYRDPLICKDFVELLDSEKIVDVIVIGHDWGSKTTSRLANLYPERFLAFGFLAVQYLPPAPEFNLDVVIEQTKKMLGYEAIGYWRFFTEDGADKVIEANFDRFHNLLFTDDPMCWKTKLAPTGALKSTLLGSDELRSGSYLTEKDKEVQKAALLKGGFKAPLSWYKLLTTGLAAKDEKDTPKERYNIEKPVFFGAALLDVLSVTAVAKHTIAQYCKNATVKDFNAGHWLALECPDQVNAELLAWIKTIKA